MYLFPRGLGAGAESMPTTRLRFCGIHDAQPDGQDCVTWRRCHATSGLSTLRGIDFGIGVAPLSERRVWRDCAKKCNAARRRKLVETAWGAQIPIRRAWH